MTLMFLPIPQCKQAWFCRISLLVCSLLPCFATAQSGRHLEEGEPLQRQLSSDEFSDRQHAMQRMWELGNETEVQAALHSDDPEVRLRARWILEQWKLGIRQQTPDSVARLLRGEDAAQLPSLADLIATKQLSQLNVALRESKAAAFRQRVQIDLLKNFPYLTYRALEFGQQEPFLDLLAEMSQLPIVALRRSQWMFQLGLSREQCLTLPKAIEATSAASRQRVEILIRWTMGMQTEAMELAAQNDPKLLLWLQLAALDWDGLAKASLEQFEAVTLPEPVGLDDSQNAATYWLRNREKATPLGLHVLALHRSEQTEACEAAVQQLIALVTSTEYHQALDTMQSQSRRYRTDLTSTLYETAETLLAVDRGPQAIDLLWDRMPLKAAELLVHQSQYSRALEALGVDVATLESSLLELTDEASQAEDESEDSEASTQPPQAFERCLAACSLAYQLGYQSAARQALRRLALRSGSGQIMQRLEVIQTAVQRNDISFAIDLAKPLLLMPSSDGRTTETLFGSSVGNELWHAVGLMEPKWSIEYRAHVLVGLSHGKLPASWHRSLDLNRLATQLHEQLGSDDGQVNASSCHEIAEFFQQYARDDWAVHFFRMAAQHNDYDSAIEIAQRQFQLGNMSAAAMLYETLWSRYPNHPETLVGLAQSLRLSGQEDEATAIDKRLDTLALDAIQYYDVAVAYAQLEDPDKAAHFAKKVIRDSPEDSTRSYHYRAIRLLLGLREDHPPAEVARLNQRLYDRVLGPTILTDMGSYQAILFDYYEASARHALISGDAALANVQMQRALRQSPADIDFAEKQLLTLRKQGHTQFVDQTLDAIFATANGHLEQFPDHANTANNIAWVAAIHDRHLDRALELSMSAVAQFPDSYTYRDTLAEVLFRQGHVDQAIQVETNCLLDVPDDYHLHQQLKRFGKDSEPSQP